jgi:putative nucleotidyltransferase with HDIG domain
MKLIQQINSLFSSLVRNEGQIIYKFLLFLVLYVALFFLLLIQPLLGFTIVPGVGDVADRDYIARSDISYLDKAITDENKKKIRLNTPPVYMYDSETTEILLQDFMTLLNSLEEGTRYNDYNEIDRVSDVAVSSEQYSLMLKLSKRNKDLINLLLSRYTSILSEGIISLDDNQSLISLTGIVVGRYEDGQLSETLYDIELMNRSEGATGQLMELINNGDVTSQQSALLKSLFTSFCRQTVFYDREASERRLTTRLEIEAPFYRKIKKNQKIVNRNEIITPEIVDALKAIEEQRSGLNEVFSLKNIVSTLGIIFLLMIFSMFILLFAQPGFFDDIRNILFVIPILLFYIIYLTMIVFLGLEKDTTVFGFYFPISMISITISFLYSKRLAAYFSIIVSLFFFVFTDYYPYSFVFVLASGLMSVYAISNVKRRVDLLMAGLKIAVMNLVITLFIVISTDNLVLYEIATLGVISVVNGITSSVVAIGLIALGEIMLNSPTVFRLQELCDSSNPLLKKLFDTASGTYNHSIMVANIAETAAFEIGANPTLAKAGGLYHDIGKIENPEYFVENQSGENIHDTLKPSVSVSIIKSHVKNGIERARKSKLPQRVIDIIAQHHGSTLIKYFYNQALEQEQSDKEEVQKTHYQYPADNPQFPEAAIVLMADQVEAATRGLKKPTMTSIEKIISGVLDDKFQEGILDDSGLTLKDITRIQKVFLKVIAGMYHTRVEYPQQGKKVNGKVKVVESDNGVKGEK